MPWLRRPEGRFKLTDRFLVILTHKRLGRFPPESAVPFTTLFGRSRARDAWYL